MIRVSGRFEVESPSTGTEESIQGGINMQRMAAAAAAVLMVASLGYADERPASVHQFKVKTIEGDDFHMSWLDGRVKLFVNVASK